MLDAHRVTITFGVPTQLAMVRETASWGRPLPHLRMFMSAGALSAACKRRRAGCRLRLARRIRPYGVRAELLCHQRSHGGGQGRERGVADGRFWGCACETRMVPTSGPTPSANSSYEGRRCLVATSAPLTGRPT